MSSMTGQVPPPDSGSLQANGAGAAHESRSSGGDSTLEQELAGKYMTFKLAAEEYGLEILKVREIIGLMEITRIPRTPDFIRGVINLRGRVIPVIDLRLKFNMERAESTSQNVIIVVQYALAGRHITTGILVDEVVEVLDIKDDRIEPPPSYGTDNINTEFILGIGKSESRVIFLLDIGRILTAAESREAVRVAKNGSAGGEP